MPKQSNDLSEEGKPFQVTKSGLKIPIPSREEFLGVVEKATVKEPSEPSQADSESPQTSREESP